MNLWAMKQFGDMVMEVIHDNIVKSVSVKSLTQVTI